MEYREPFVVSCSATSFRTVRMAAAACGLRSVSIVFDFFLVLLSSYEKRVISDGKKPVELHNYQGSSVW
jgi:hypothetical protein